MTPRGKAILLAEKPGLGRVWDCGECGNIHVTIGPVTVCLDPSAYMGLVDMLNASAANFEEWIEYKQAGGARLDDTVPSSGACFPEHPPQTMPGFPDFPDREQTS